MMVQFSGTTLTGTLSRQRVQLKSGERSARAAPIGVSSPAIKHRLKVLEAKCDWLGHLVVLRTLSSSYYVTRVKNCKRIEGLI